MLRNSNHVESKIGELHAHLEVLRAALSSDEVNLNQIRHHLECYVGLVIEQLKRTEQELQDGGVL